MAKRGIKFEHSVGEVVLCFEPDATKARVLYDAKVLDSQVSKDKQGRKCAAYLVHFQGWNNSWDRLVPESFILKATEDNKTLMKRLTETAKKYRKNRQRRRKIDLILREANVKAPPQYDSESDTSSGGSGDDSDTDNSNHASVLQDYCCLTFFPRATQKMGRGNEYGRSRSENTFFYFLQFAQQYIYSVVLYIYVNSTLNPQNSTFSMALLHLPHFRVNRSVILIIYLFLQQARRSQENSPVTIEIPDILKSRLEDDYTAVSIRGKLCSLPAKPCVMDILEGFMKTFCVNYICEPVERDPLAKERDKTRVEKYVLRLPAENVFALSKELVDGLRILFDFTLPIILLYATEQEQYESVMKNTKPGDVIPGVHEIEKAPASPGSKPRRGRPPSQKVEKQSRTEQHEVEEAASSSDITSRRMTRRSTIDPPFPDDHSAPAAVPTKRQKKQDGAPSPKLSPRATRRRGLHEEPLVVKVEDNSDTEIEFSPPASTSTTNNGMVNPWSQIAGTEAVASASHGQKEDLTHNILTWQIVPTEVRKQPPVLPSQVYGVQHLLRLFVKLPELLNRMPFEEKKLEVLVKLCHHCLLHLVDHQQEFYL
ncbi:MSL complex subunit 3-like [Littorina saxatilis]|uniref:MSL complex subunit 3-like n=1 Tax=Littorina saxatilis TaxID=31220 RepID=UPI0038B5A6B7